MLRLVFSVQFTADELAAGAVERAQTFRVRGMRLKLAALPDLVELKLAAAEEPRRRPSKRVLDVRDVLALLEDHPELEAEVPDARTRAGRAIRAATLSGAPRRTGRSAGRA